MRRFCLAILWLTVSAQAEAQGVYVGVVAGVDLRSASYAKTTDNTDPRNVSLQRGRVFHKDDASRGAGSRMRLFTGYRQDIGEGRVYHGGKVDAAWHGGSTGGQLSGIGTAQYGESWPDEWSLEKRPATVSRFAWVSDRVCCASGRNRAPAST